MIYTICFGNVIMLSSQRRKEKYNAIKIYWNLVIHSAIYYL